ncbi:MAG: hypothetical protein LBS36_13040 [Oscillospiraceae bacterium]|jgi:hypothetical protein|nr:hypothetical protein [Oscillospiraceae bacterium]
MSITTNEKAELQEIITTFANSYWDLIDAPAKAWLERGGAPETRGALIAAIEQADKECGSCGCDFDPLYKRALELKKLI